MIEKKNKQIMFLAVRVILVVNGVYDVVCAACILKGRERQALEESISDSSALSSCFDLVSDLHIKMFRDDDNDNNEKSMAKNDIARRMLGYWVLTYGIVRLSLAAVFYCEQYAFFIGSITYLVESFCFWYEHCAYGTLVPSKAIFVCVFSILLFVFINASPFF